MYVILVNNDDTMTTANKERIVQRSKLFKKMWFLAEQIYQGCDMTHSTVSLEYLTPISREYRHEFLTLSDEKYKGYLTYELPIDTAITKEAGSIELQLTFLYTDIDADGNKIQRVRKTAPAIRIEIVPISAWSDIIPDSALSALDQRILKMDAQLKAIQELNELNNETKADNIKYNSKENSLQLLSGDKEIGDRVVLKDNQGITEDGIPIVDFSSTSFTPDDDSNKEESNVVEF